jgi:hypothetical protein
MLALGVLLCGGLAGCARLDGAAKIGASRPGAQSAAGESAYRTPPAVITAAGAGGARIRLDGFADPGSRVRLATPDGHAEFAQADADGRWRVAIPDAGAVRLFGVSMAEGGRTVQSESYLALLPGGRAVQLRSGAGAVALGAPPALGVTAVDFDRKGGAVISGRAPAGATVDVTVDGTLRGHAPADPQGRWSLDLDEPLGRGDHAIAASTRGARAAVSAQLGAPAPLTDGPFVADRTADGWRIEWVTPAGGVQTTLVFNPRGASA